MVHCYLSGNPVHDRVIKAFYDGCPLEKKLLTFAQYEPSEVAVIFGVGKKKVPVSWPRGKVFRQQRSQNKDVIVLETGYINRGDGENHHYAAGFNGLNGRADFRNEDMPDDRAKLLGVKLEPYTGGKHILICGQVPWDASVEGTDHLAWIEQTGKRIHEITSRPIRFRPHPLSGMGTPKDRLEDDLKDCHAVVTFNSNSGVEAVIAGKAVFAADEGSMVYRIANNNIEEIEIPFTWLDEDGPMFPDREQWLANIAYTQWTPAEMAEGLTWKHLTR
jgi:hypothetical protein